MKKSFIRLIPTLVTLSVLVTFFAVSIAPVFAAGSATTSREAAVCTDDPAASPAAAFSRGGVEGPPRGVTPPTSVGYWLQPSTRSIACNLGKVRPPEGREVSLFRGYRLWATARVVTRLFIIATTSSGRRSIATRC